MKAQTTAISQDGSAGEFFCQGALITHVNTAARTAECHAFSFGRASAGSKAGARRRSTTRYGQDDGRSDACQTEQFREAGFL